MTKGNESGNKEESKNNSFSLDDLDVTNSGLTDSDIFSTKRESINPFPKKRGFLDRFKKNDGPTLELRDSRNSGFEDEESEELDNENLTVSFLDKIVSKTPQESSEPKPKFSLVRDDFYNTFMSQSQNARNLRRELFVQDSASVSIAAQKTLEEKIIKYQKDKGTANNTQDIDEKLEREKIALTELIDIPRLLLERNREKIVNDIHDIIKKPKNVEKLSEENTKLISQWIKKINLGEGIDEGKDVGKINGQWSVYQPESYNIPKELEGFYSPEQIKAIQDHVVQITKVNEDIEKANTERRDALEVINEKQMQLQKENKGGLIEAVKEDPRTAPFIEKSELIMAIEDRLSYGKEIKLIDKNQSKRLQNAHATISKNTEVIKERLEIFKEQLEKDGNAALPGMKHLLNVIELNNKAIENFNNGADKEASKYSDLAARYIDKARLGGLETHKDKLGEYVPVLDSADVLATSLFTKDDKNSCEALEKINEFKNNNKNLLNNKTFAPRIREMEDNLARIQDAWKPGVNDEEAARAWEKISASMSKLEESGKASFLTRGKKLKEVDALLKEAKTYAGYAAGPSDEPLIQGEEPGFFSSLIRRITGKSLAPDVTREEKKTREDFGRILQGERQAEMFDVIGTPAPKITPKLVAEKLTHHKDEKISGKAEVYLELVKIDENKSIQDRRSKNNSELREKVEKMPEAEKHQIRNLFKSVAEKFKRANTSGVESTGLDNKKSDQGQNPNMQKSQDTKSM